MSDGSIFLLYAKDIGEFNVTKENGNNSLENSLENGSQWQRQKAVMMIKTDDMAKEWTAPFEVSQRKPLMILNGVDYLSSVYDPLTERLKVFVRCYNITDEDNPVEGSCGGDEEDGTGYVGCFTINLLKTSHLYLDCTPVEDIE